MKTKFFTLALALFAQIVFAQIARIWKAELDVRGKKIPMIIDVKEQGNQLKSLAYSPKQTAKSFPVDKTSFANGDFSFKIEMLGAEYSGKLNGDEITGNFSQNGATFPLTLHRISAQEFKNTFPKDVEPIGNREINFKKN